MFKKYYFTKFFKNILKFSLFFLAAGLFAHASLPPTDNSEIDAAIVDVEHVNSNNIAQWKVEINQVVIEIKSVIKKKSDLNAEYINLYKAAVNSAFAAPNKTSAKAALLQANAIAQEANKFASKTTIQLNTLSDKLKSILRSNFNTDLDQLADEVDEAAELFDGIASQWKQSADKAKRAAS